MSFLKTVMLFTAYAQAQHGEPETVPVIEHPPVTQSGLASWYGNGDWHGDQTANGEIFNPYKAHTCAHRTLPFDTVILIENQSNGLRTWCRINDRGPYGMINQQGEWNVTVSSASDINWRGILDMSVITARDLQTTEVGLQKVNLYYWKPLRAAFDLAVWMP